MENSTGHPPAEWELAAVKKVIERTTTVMAKLSDNHSLPSDLISLPQDDIIHLEKQLNMTIDEISFFHGFAKALRVLGATAEEMVVSEMRRDGSDMSNYVLRKTVLRRARVMYEVCVSW